jgi:hypothetical protein
MLANADVLIAAQIVETRDLLAEFGLKLCGMDPGVTAYFTRPDQPKSGRGYLGEPFALDRNEWMWLRPILIELRDRRIAMRGDDAKSDDAKTRLELAEVIANKRKEIEATWPTTKSGSRASRKPTRPSRSVQQRLSAAGFAKAGSGLPRPPWKSSSSKHPVPTRSASRALAPKLADAPTPASRSKSTRRTSKTKR